MRMISGNKEERNTNIKGIIAVAVQVQVLRKNEVNVKDIETEVRRKIKNTEERNIIRKEKVVKIHLQKMIEKTEERNIEKEKKREKIHHQKKRLNTKERK